MRTGPCCDQLDNEHRGHAFAKQLACYPRNATQSEPAPPVLHNDFLGLFSGNTASQKVYEPPNVNLGDVFRDDFMLEIW